MTPPAAAPLSSINLCVCFSDFRAKTINSVDCLKF